MFGFLLFFLSQFIKYFITFQVLPRYQEISLKNSSPEYYVKFLGLQVKPRAEYLQHPQSLKFVRSYYVNCYMHKQTYCGKHLFSTVRHCLYFRIFSLFHYAHTFTFTNKQYEDRFSCFLILVVKKDNVYLNYY